MKQTKIDEVERTHATPEKVHRADETRARGSMGDVEKIHGTAPVDPAAVKAKAAKQRINPEAYGVEDATPASRVVEPVAKKHAAPAPARRGRKPAEPE